MQKYSTHKTQKPCQTFWSSWDVRVHYQLLEYNYRTSVNYFQIDYNGEEHIPTSVEDVYRTVFLEALDVNTTAI